MENVYSLPYYSWIPLPAALPFTSCVFFCRAICRAAFAANRSSSSSSENIRDHWCSFTSVKCGKSEFIPRAEIPIVYSNYYAFRSGCLNWSGCSVCWRLGLCKFPLKNGGVSECGWTPPLDIWCAEAVVQAHSSVNKHEYHQSNRLLSEHAAC